MNLQEANLHHVKVDSNDPLHISSHSDGSIPSFVAAPGAARLTIDRTKGETDDETRVIEEEEINCAAREASGRRQECSSEDVCSVEVQVA